MLGTGRLANTVFYPAHVRGLSGSYIWKSRAAAASHWHTQGEGIEDFIRNGENGYWSAGFPQSIAQTAALSGHPEESSRQLCEDKRMQETDLGGKCPAYLCLFPIIIRNQQMREKYWKAWEADNFSRYWWACWLLTWLGFFGTAMFL
jgi:hypothetical protein